MRGDAAGALAELGAQYADGADPMAVLRDLAEITHWISVIKINPAAAEDPTTPPDEQARGTDLAARLPMRALTRMWQMLLKAVEEVALAPNAMMAAEMAVIRLTHVADLPDPETLVKRLSDAPRPEAPRSGPVAGGAPAGGGTVHAPRLAPVMAAPTRGPVMTAAAPALAESALQVYASFDAVVELIRQKRDILLLNDVETGVRLVRYAPGRVEFEPAAGAKPDLAQRLGQRLQGWTGSRWAISVVAQGGAATIDETRRRTQATAFAEAEADPAVQAILAAFPGARVTEVRSPESLTAEAKTAALPQADPEGDDWDPFEA
jgi:DNA polymerase-3 subunit gamma/tau